jgi:hypothetical protein
VTAALVAWGLRRADLRARDALVPTPADLASLRQGVVAVGSRIRRR